MPEVDHTSAVLAEVAQERKRQDEKWGEQNHPDGTGPHVPHAEFLGYADERRDSARRRCDFEHQAGRGTWAQILEEEHTEALAESDPETLRAELIQVAAVAVQWIEAIDRRSTEVTR